MTESVTLDELVVPITVDYLEADGVYQVSCLALQGCHAWGETLDEALRAVSGNIRAMIDARRSKGVPVPALFEQVGGQVPFVLRMVPA